MITKLYRAESASNIPYYNLALEKYLFENVLDGEIIFYLWQNRRTVVCGRNQNMYKECRISQLIEDSGYPARRLSGGGAVFHDLGNLNFTFLVKEADYDLDKQLSVILNACRSLGIKAEKTGRNDITVDGRKFSGNAFHSSGGRRYHHGTLMVNVDMDMLSHYLNVDKAKLASKGVASVRSRVVNLSEFNPELDIAKMKQTLWEVFEETYGLPSYMMEPPIETELEETVKLFSSDGWLYGRVGNFSMQINRRFEWGDFDLRIDARCAKINEAVIYSDANDAAYIRELAANMEGAELSATELGAIAENLAGSDEQRRMAQDIRKLLIEEL